VREFARLAICHGWDIRTLTSAMGIVASSLDQPCHGLTKAKAAAMIRRLRGHTDDEFLGLGSHPVSRNTLRAMAFAISGAPTLEEALTRLEDFGPVFAGLPILMVSSTPEQTTVRFDLDGFDNEVSVVTSAILAIAHRVLNWVTRHRIQLDRVDLPHRRPLGETDYDVIFGATIRFEAPQAALIFPRAIMSAPLARRQDEIEQFLSDPAAALLSQFDFYTTYAHRVRGMFERCLGDHVCTADEIASGMGISRQTLRRRLLDENTSLTAIRDDVLRCAALEGLSSGTETVAALACRLGFSEPSAFSRAFRRWTGGSPSTYLRQQASP
jgi:AraC-like DNA-binding protein